MRYCLKNSRLSAGTLFVALAGIYLLGSSAALAVPPAKSAPSSPPPTLTDLGVLENRFFSHPYAHDPVEKRIERLECMVFGGVQAGTNEERLLKVMKVIADRSQKPLDKAATPDPSKQSAAAASPAGTPGTQSNSSAQYPVLNTLEWRALKKTYPAEGLEQRLDRLESKMFGQPAQSMAYADRVERLRKTLGIGIDTGLDAPLATRGTGPAPRARPRDDAGGQPFAGAMPGAGGLMPGMPEFGLNFGFGGGDSIFDATFDKQLHQMMEQMNKHMSEARRLGPGQWRFDPKTNNWIDIQSGRKASPDDSSDVPRLSPPRRIFSNPPSVAPPRKTAPMEEIPPYADPNSI